MMMMLTTLALLVQISPSSIPKHPLYTADNQKVECRLVQEVHSRIPSRICRTEADWLLMAKENQAALESSRNDRTLGCRGMLGC